MRKSSPRTLYFRAAPSQNAGKLASFREQMADYARGERLRDLRERKHASQETVAFEVGVSTKTLRTWEHGGKIRWENAQRVATFYGVDPESLVSREEAGLSVDGDEPLTQLDRIEQRLESLDDQIRQLRFDVIGREMEELQRASGAAAPTPASRRRRRPAASA